MKGKQLKRFNLQQEKLTQFEQEFDRYEEKDMGGEIWIKNWNGNTKRWQVSVFSPSSFKRYKGNNQNYQELQDQEDHFYSI